MITMGTLNQYWLESTSDQNAALVMQLFVLMQSFPYVKMLHQATYQIWQAKLKGYERGLNAKIPISLLYLAEFCNLKDKLRQGQFLLYRPMLYIQQWISTLNEMEGGEMLKSPSWEVLSTGAWYKKTPNDNLHTLATARLSGHKTIWCQVCNVYKEDIGSGNTLVSTF